jgi:hypothetical protein
LLAGLAFAAPVVQAREHLGPIDNLLLKNPYANPAGAFFGRGVVAGDVDNDGIDDLIVSENGGDRLRALLGNPFDVGSDPLFPFSPSTVSMPNHGYVMAAGDFDGDDRDEIAVAYPNSSVGGESGAGKVYVMNRRPADGEWEVQSTIQAGGAYPGAVQAQANLGNSLASGDFDDDGYDDLAIGMRGQVVGGFENAGAVMVVYGGILGVNGSYGAEIFDRDSDGLTFSPRINDYYGWALTTGDFDAERNRSRWRRRRAERNHDQHGPYNHWFEDLASRHPGHWWRLCNVRQLWRRPGHWRVRRPRFPRNQLRRPRHWREWHQW